MTLPQLKFRGNCLKEVILQLIVHLMSWQQKMILCSILRLTYYSTHVFILFRKHILLFVEFSNIRNNNTSHDHIFYCPDMYFEVDIAMAIYLKVSRARDGGPIGEVESTVFRCIAATTVFRR